MRPYAQSVQVSPLPTSRRVYPTFLIFCFLFTFSTYKNIAQWSCNDYHTTVTASDEAFVLQVMTYYYPRWTDPSLHEETSVSESVVSGGTGGRGGPARGFKGTACKTIRQYHEYVSQMGRSRAGVNAKLWSGRLKEAAKKTLALSLAESQASENGVVEDEPPTDFMEYTKFDFFDMDEFDIEGDESSGKAVSEYIPKVSV